MEAHKIDTHHFMYGPIANFVLHLLEPTSLQNIVNCEDYRRIDVTGN